MRRKPVPLAALAFAAACALEPPYERTNPFDPGSNVEMRLVGPDSTHAMAERFRLTIDAEPPLPDARRYIVWRSADTLVVPDGDGWFIVRTSTSRYVNVALSASFDEVVVAKTLAIGQSVDTVRISCAPWTQAFVPCDAMPLAPGATRALHARIVDPGGILIREPAYAIGRATFISRDPSVVSAGPVLPNAAGTYWVAGVGTGSTWVVLRVDRAVDSARIVVP